MFEFLGHLPYSITQELYQNKKKGGGGGGGRGGGGALVAQLDVHLTGDQEVVGLIPPGLVAFFHGH